MVTALSMFESLMEVKIPFVKLLPPIVYVDCIAFHFLIIDFDWSISNDFLVSASSDMTAQVWESSTGQNVRVLKDSFGSPVMSCRFMPLNNNFIVVSFCNACVLIEKHIFNRFYCVPLGPNIFQARWKSIFVITFIFFIILLECSQKFDIS